VLEQGPVLTRNAVGVNPNLCEDVQGRNASLDLLGGAMGASVGDQVAEFV
jgi:hypothetical protein